ncbi:MAG: dihydrofolate reductase family protein [Desertimonas sp.]
MARLIYLQNVALDGYFEDAEGDFNWTEPDDELFVFITDLVRPVGTYLYGRRLYETMAVWETDPAFAAESDLMADFADVWQTADKVVYSTTLETAFTARTRIERRFDPAAVRALKAAATGDLVIGGAELAAQAFGAGLVDEYHLLVRPVVLGAGRAALPLARRVDLGLIEQREVGNGVLSLRYDVRT